MRCKDAKKLIPLHAGGDLAAGADLLDAHVASCPACARELASMRGVIGAMRSAGESAPRLDPAAFAEGLAERMRRPRAAAPRFSVALRAALTAAAAVAAVAAVLAVISAFETREAPPAAADPLSPAAVNAPSEILGQLRDAQVGSRNVFFKLSSSSLEPLSGADFELNAFVVPDPSAREHLGHEDFMLREFTPVDDTEVSADF